MNLEHYQEIFLLQDVPEYGIYQGDITTLIDFIPHSGSGETGCILDTFNAVGESI
ncbi:DUF4926 domain-containing protein [Roseofilum reptotaenium CS-1145]|uniref:DUF4926 domain-containing protein n=1 Tax=Roseofilum TaxID=1233426 RepID=UPI001B00C3A1|nr:MULTISPECIES: DUF4926 domain-containing protein [Roseofilum]MBP0028422.1 DUF4926 domain-containing protein [Roseofilum sp. Guam]MDB9519042.1 DUF4926 domain-containing protein [Roseofilum reptotaenium CS-1145]